MMKYFSILYSKKAEDPFAVRITVTRKEFKNDSECAVFVMDELQKGYEYIDIQPITENIYKNVEVKRMEDYSYGVRQQKRYTKKEEWVKTTDFIRSVLVR